MRVSRVGGLLAIGAPAPTAGAPNAVLVSGPGQQPLTALSHRTAGAVTLRIFTTPPGGSGAACAASGGCIPDWCQSTRPLITELSTPAMAAVLDSDVIGLGPGSPLSVLGTFGAGTPYGGVTYASSPGGTSAYSSGLVLQAASPSDGEPAVVGVAEGDPVQVVSVRVAPTVATVTLKTSHGEDSMAPVDGLAVVAVEGASSAGQLTATDAHGHTVTTVPLPTRPTAATPACAVQPPTLPPPGVQPADPAAATAAVRQAYATAFTSVPGRIGAPATVQDGNQLVGALNQVRQNFPQAAATSTVKTGQLVFTSPTTASVVFTVTYQQGAPYG
ncbi:MAG: hypothetical protein ACRDTP_01690, partial [Mycobacteriales bacterium]